MNITRKDLEKGQIELNVELSVDELKPLMEKGAESISKEVKVEGFRPGKVPFDVLKQKVGELAILEEAAKLSINKNIYKVLEDNIKDKQVVGQPEVEITKIAVGSPLEYRVRVNILPEVTVGKYKDFDFKQEKLEVTEEEISKVLNDLIEMRAKEKISDKTIEKGDKVIASVNLFIENVPVEDGQNPEVTIMIGKNYFVDGFDKNLIGLKKGDKKEFNLVYPDKHWQKNLSGKLVDFKVEIKEVYSRELPELNDELAKIFQFNNMEHLKENLSKTIESQKKREMDQKMEVKILDKVVDNFKFGDIAESLIKSEASLMMREMEQSVVSQGGKFDDYLNSINKTQNELMLEILPGATKRVKSALAMKEIAEIEKISISDAEMEKELDSLKKKYGHDSKVIENLSSAHYKAYLENMMLNQKTVEALKKWNIKDENSSDK
ncbi:trigger factor [Candidatus Falkowbacteria bacterium HGW-Falkowbacteria-1]|uniref:Trigger factor n=1 Tax=Candidatus Falkowbacteria bacterium HGW-Falkowbacteria-1 TaxID=2013768 RepID=A0A2N2EA74_9BACT|nr:MAG: trigger factor [Candidatus Falkowbacteria bacterium HGW-Falkowbacteria-1]